MIDEDSGRLLAQPRLRDVIARQFSLPEGSGGIAVAAAMRFVNWLPNRRAIDLLDVGPSDDVLEIGFGPGHALKTLCRLAPSGTVTGVDRSGTMCCAASVRNRVAVDDGRPVTSPMATPVVSLRVIDVNERAILSKTQNFGDTRFKNLVAGKQ